MSQCRDCRFCVQGEIDPNNPGQRPYNCYAKPPLTTSMLTAQGVVIMTMRPVITLDDIACKEFSLE